MKTLISAHVSVYGLTRTSDETLFLFLFLSSCIIAGISGELCTGDEPWFFFSPRQERETHGGRPNRLTPSGYWKATGTPSYVFSTTDNHHRKIGLKRTMVFHEGKAPTGNKTKWKVNEYKALEEASTSSDAPKVYMVQELKNRKSPTTFIFFFFFKFILDV